MLLLLDFDGVLHPNVSRDDGLPCCVAVEKGEKTA